jgi:folate-dependent tRNA-U54 methylase TrmFO/GidA
MKIRDKKMRNEKIATNALEKIKQWKDGLSIPTHS